jgi:hypothetical protein
MQFGRFDNARREYVITRPTRPCHAQRTTVRIFRTRQRLLFFFASTRHGSRSRLAARSISARNSTTGT